jgi:hypothetical protein
MTTPTTANHTTSTRDTGTGSPGAGPIGIAVLGVMIVAAAFVALIVAGTAAADLFSPAGVDVSDRGVWMATQAWATPLALTGLAVLFAGAVPVALRNIRSAISFRRDSMVNGLPVILAVTGTDNRNTFNSNTFNSNTFNKENVR